MVTENLVDLVLDSIMMIIGFGIAGLLFTIGFLARDLDLVKSFFAIGPLCFAFLFLIAMMCVAKYKHDKIEKEGSGK